MSRKKAYINGTIAVNIQKIGMGILGFVITPIILKLLGKDQYGIWLLISNIMGYLNLVDGGVSGASTALISRTIGNKDGLKDEVNKLFSSVFFLQLGSGLLFLLVGIGFAFVFPYLFNIQPKSEVNPVLIFIFSVLSFFISFILRPFTGLLVGNQKIALNASIEFFVFILNNVLALLFIYLGFGLIGLPIAGVISRVMSLPIYLFILKKQYSTIQLSWSNFSLDQIKRIYKISSWWFFGVLSAMIIYSSDNIVIAKFLGPAAITAYALTFQLANFIRERIYTFNSVAMPGIGQLFGANELDKLRELYLKTQKLVWFIAIYSSVIIISFNSDLMHIWVGDQYFLGHKINFIMSLYLFLTIIFHSSSIIISASLDIKKISILRFIEAGINIVLSIILIQKFGYIGLCMSTVIASLVTNFWFAPYKVMKILEIDFKKYFDRVLTPIVIPVSLLVLFCFLTWIPNKPVNFWVRFILFIPLSYTSLWHFILDSKTKNYVLSKIKK